MNIRIKYLVLFVGKTNRNGDFEAMRNIFISLCGKRPCRAVPHREAAGARNE